MNIQKSFQEEPGSHGSGKGSLYLVATPIGNLEDMTFRAVRTLKEADWIAAEDTRQTRKLLAHYDIAARLVSYHEHNKQTSGPELLRKLLNGESVALVSDAGMPAVSDPGFDLVKLAIDNGVNVIPIPGANAALSALTVSGLPTDAFLFAGFLPREKKELRESLEKLKRARQTIVLYEAPHRVEKTLRAILEVWGDRAVALARELTKKHEEIIRGTVSECLAFLEQHQPRGEFCIVVHGSTREEQGEEDGTWWRLLSVEEHVEHYMRQGGSRKEALKKAAADRGLPKRELYNRLI